MDALLKTIRSPRDLEGFSHDQLKQLAAEMREALCRLVATRSAHFASNLGVVELAIALSFSLLGEALQREPWAPDEQRAVREYIVECLAEGATLPCEFLYLPLLLGGIIIADQVVFEGEDVTESVRLLGQAKAERGDLFKDEDLSDLNDAFDRLIARQARRRAGS